MLRSRLKNIVFILWLWLQNRVFARIKHPSLTSLRVFYIGGYWRGPNDVVAMMLDGLETLGVQVFEFNTDEHFDALDVENPPYDRGTSGPVWLVWERVAPSILRFRPHLIICNAGGLSFRPKGVAALRGWGIRLLGIALSDPEVYEVTTSRICHNFDVYYTIVKEFVERYRSAGVDAHRLPIATSDIFFRPMPSRPEYACEVLMLGAVHEDRIEPVRALVEHFDTHVYGENWEKYGFHNRGFLYGEDTLSALNSAKMAIIFPRTVSGFKAVKLGIFDFFAAGGLVITEDFPDLHEYFEVGREVIAFTDTEDMLKKVRYYLDHPDEADAIRQAGRKRVVENYTWKKAWPAILKTALPLADS